MIMKPCSKPGCINKIPRGQKPAYCAEHQRKQSRTYDKQRNPQAVAFYNSAAWRKFRANVLAERLHLCEPCRERGELNAADTVHHIIEIKDDWSMRLCRSNVQAICRACHNRVHARGFINK